MAYRFANQSEVKELEAWCMEILHAVQDEVREYFTFDIRLIGSGDKRLVTQNGDECFDLDYNIIMQKDKKGLLDNPKQIKDIFVKRFKAVLEENVSGYNYVSDSTSVITAKLIRNDKIEFSFDVAIIVEGDDGYFYRLTHDKRTNRYIWNQVANSKNYFAKFKAIKENGYWMEFKQRYLKNKDRHLSNQDGVKSFSIFLETLNEFYR
ncbi:putative uncharacterized protein [Firmicutes bacterium CAG:552]|nr:putative uncharacterized protein [Firmicutes bacterium CAG:552]